MEDDPIDLGSLGGLPFISLDPFAIYQEGIKTLLAETSVEVNYVCEISSVVTVVHLVRAGVGCAFLNPYISGSVRGTRVKVVPVRQILMHAYGIYALSGGPLSHEASKFLESIFDHAHSTQG